MRILALGLLTGVGVTLGCLPAFAQQAYTTRIEPRPFYGATVTLEEGVRVFRPLPPHDRVIINTGNSTPIVLEGGDRLGRRGYFVYPRDRARAPR
ncbi:MAG: hypothetical protein F9K29_13145 [Hyphomicrobiaceae bacterium]|nr:MAG: hypothetical protein F9K29_13145 [Hyphomicrobiaceae bacterium]